MATSIAVRSISVKQTAIHEFLFSSSAGSVYREYRSAGCALAKLWYNQVNNPNLPKGGACSEVQTTDLPAQSISASSILWNTLPASFRQLSCVDRAAERIRAESNSPRRWTSCPCDRDFSRRGLGCVCSDSSRRSLPERSGAAGNVPCGPSCVSGDHER